MPHGDSHEQFICKWGTNSIAMACHGWLEGTSKSVFCHLFLTFSPALSDFRHYQRGRLPWSLGSFSAPLWRFSPKSEWSRPTPVSIRPSSGWVLDPDKPGLEGKSHHESQMNLALGCTWSCICFVWVALFCSFHLQPFQPFCALANSWLNTASAAIPH